MSVKHTPGLWQVVPGVGDCLEIIHIREDGGFVTIATLQPDISQPGDKGGFATKEDRAAACIANAKLIAAAPEMQARIAKLEAEKAELLAALEAILGSECAILNELRDQAQSAIAKAKGEQQA